MRRFIAGVVAALLLPLLGVVVEQPAVAAPETAPTPRVKHVERSYGAGAVRLAPRQGLDIGFRARRGDEVMIEVRSRRDRFAPCSFTQTIADARGRRTARVDYSTSARIMRVRSTGRVELRFRGACGFDAGRDPHPVSVRLVKVRSREVARDDRTAVRGERPGYLDVAWVRVARDGRDTLTLRTSDGTVQRVQRSRVVVGDRVFRDSLVGSVSVEAGQRILLPLRGPQLRTGMRVGLVAPAKGYAESLRAREHRVELDGPALTLPAEPGREHVLVYAATAEDRPYVLPLGIPENAGDIDDPTWWPWRTYTGCADPDDPTLRRTIVASDPEGAGPEALQVRMRRTVRVPDLVVGGPPVTFSSVEPGTRFFAAIPVPAVGAVRLSATDVSTTGRWQTWVPPVFCPRDCMYPGLSAGPDALTADGYFFSAAPHELQLTFAPSASGSVTLQLTDIP
ncbi:hypothetical protein CFI00_11820 [Nocardioides sp. S5]|uniref:hypothetical protein n=1 Tax=Nocardioides sp. S5 TaxID=2017486 RepID=UPI001A8FB352|nr:hypothetical protein [Nocardioides sp. S5]QSR31175.1 hypothetical protein CFI00_11820 [Nocardioides sp. S5]